MQQIRGYANREQQFILTVDRPSRLWTEPYWQALNGCWQAFFESRAGVDWLSLSTCQLACQ